MAAFKLVKCVVLFVVFPNRRILQNGDECSGNNLEGNGQVVGAVQR